MSRNRSRRRTAADIAAMVTMEQSDIEEELSDLEPDEIEAAIPEARTSSDSSSDYEDDIEEQSSSNIVGRSLTAPSGQKWTTQPPSRRGRVPASNVIRQRPGLTGYAAQRITEDIVSSFNILFDHSMIETLITETNRQGQRKKGDAWNSIDSNEMNAYLGICILRGVYRSSNEPVRDLWNKHAGRKIFGETMSINRFEEIRAMLRFDNRLTRSSRIQRDKLAAVRLLIDGFISNAKLCYVHNDCVTIDEQLYPFKGRCFLVQYMPNKPCKYGLKFWILADSSNYYISNIDLYTGKEDSRTRPLGEHVVMKLSEHLFGSGRNITCDNFFTSLQLSRELAKKQLTLVGTIRSHRREVPHPMRGYQGRELYSSIFAYTIEEATQLVSYKSKTTKTVLLLSTQHRSQGLSNDLKKKPESILYYNATKGGVDAVDERISTYSVKYRSRRWHVAVFCDILDMVCYNAFILYTTAFPDYNANKSHRRRCFLTDLGMALSRTYRQQRSGPDQTSTAVEPTLAVVQPSVTRKRCYICPRSSDRKSHVACRICGRNVCSTHTVFKCINCH